MRELSHQCIKNQKKKPVPREKLAVSGIMIELVTMASDDGNQLLLEVHSSCILTEVQAITRQNTMSYE